MIETTHLITYGVKIGLSLILSLIIGHERESQKKPAGIRDVSLVTLGATLYAMIGLHFTEPMNMDMTRLLYAPIIGIGFLGSGVIIQQKNKLEGITTASLLFAMVSIGLLIGIGDYILAGMASIAIYLLLKLKHINISIHKTIKKKRRKK